MLLCVSELIHAERGLAVVTGGDELFSVCVCVCVSVGFLETACTAVLPQRHVSSVNEVSHISYHSHTHTRTHTHTHTHKLGFDG